ncbi:OmpA/MotB family protein [Alkalimarinus alittae]|uniref:OmpA family protein n=1 Tax=Alkalimarinus alittae TaxID=2961619 RepID=A0ABY6MYA7_9ALTE|nr:OmpA family protein [Alkalimarinus alittae]UZE94826.1 OmpA family protein [Alkalimarinus alittae]
MAYQPYCKPIAAVVTSPTYYDDFALEDKILPDQRVDSESWLLSYIDVFLLIIAFLIIMLLKSTDQTSAAEQPLVNDPTPLATPLTTPLATPQTTPQTAHDPAPQALTETLRGLSADHRITVASNDRHISVRLDNTLMFDSSKAVIKPEGKQAILALVPTLKALNKPLVIEGHTDNTPINTSLYPSNWELSAARANSVLHYLSSQGVPKSLLSTANYADTRPLAPNNSQTNRSMNRRVNLLILIEGASGNSDFKL